jgi:penicillin-binding protein 2
MDERRPLWNFAIQSRAEPGSIFKMVTGLAALTNGRLTVTDEISDEGPYMKYTNKVEDAPTCWISKGNRKDHANLNIVGGLSKSCNYFFYTLAGRLYGETGSNLLYQYAAKLGLTTRTGIQLPGEARSVVGNQTSLYDPTLPVNQQETSLPLLVAAKIKRHLQNIGASYGISYDDKRLDACIKRLMDMALVTGQEDWSDAMRPILMAELNMTRDMVWLQAVIGEIWYSLNDIKWGGSMEVQMAIGQSITVLTPAAVSRYIAAIGNGGTVYNLSIINSIISPEGEILNQYQPSIFGTLEGSEPYMPYIKQGMKGVVDEAGTAKRYFDGWAYQDELWAKTGTSQVMIGGIKLDLENNGWFVALAPFTTPAEIAVVVLIPNGKAGAEATRAARDFIGWWFEDKNKYTGDVPVVPGNQLMP